MTRLLALLAALILSACAGPEPIKAEEGPTFRGQRDLDALVSFFTGNWDPDQGEPRVRMRAVEFWHGSQVRWLYLEWVDMANEARVTRQLVLRLAEDGETKMISTTRSLPGDPARFAGEWRKAKPFEGLHPRDFPEIEGCRFGTVRAMTMHFTLVTQGNKCPSGQPGYPYFRFEFSLTSSELELLEQPRDAAGNIARGREEPYRYLRMSREPK